MNDTPSKWASQLLHDEYMKWCASSDSDMLDQKIALLLDRVVAEERERIAKLADEQAKVSDWQASCALENFAEELREVQP